MLRERLKGADRYFSGATDAPRMPNVLGILGHHVRLGSGWLAYNSVLLNEPALDPRHRELMILRVAWRTGARYEWAQHVRLAKRVGITDEEIDAIAGSPEADTWAPVEHDLLAATDQLLDRYNIEATTWSRLSEHFDEPRLLELLFVVGSYLCLALVFNSVGLELDPELDSSRLPPPRDARP